MMKDSLKCIRVLLSDFVNSLQHSLKKKVINFSYVNKVYCCYGGCFVWFG